MDKLAFLLFELMNDGKIFKDYLIERADGIRVHYGDEEMKDYREVFENSELGAVAKSIVKGLSE